ncbi:MAG: fibronectin type III domain-containing protein, partial [Candidatus Kariarchaeaceae archaeon]
MLVPFVSILSANTFPYNVSSVAVDNPKHIHLTYQNNPASTITVTWQTDTSKANNIVLYDT